MPSFSDSIFLFVLALLLFGPKKLPVLARELGKWMGEFRRASNDFKMQMEEELRLSEQADREKKIAAIEAAAPVAPAFQSEAEVNYPDYEQPQIESSAVISEPTSAEPLPIATSGELNMMPPATGLPVSRSDSAAEPAAAEPATDPFGGLLSNIPSVDEAANKEAAKEQPENG